MSPTYGLTELAADMIRREYNMGDTGFGNNDSASGGNNGSDSNNGGNGSDNSGGDGNGGDDGSASIALPSFAIAAFSALAAVGFASW